MVMNIAGTFHGRFWNPVGSLADAGENLTLVDGLGRQSHDFDYEDDWYPHTDGEGYSLTSMDPLADANPARPMVEPPVFLSSINSKSLLV